MNRSIVFRIIAGLVLLATLAGIAFFAYQAGVAQSVAQGLAQGAAGSVPTDSVPQSNYWLGWHYGRGGLFFAPFFLLRCLVALFLLCLAFSAFRFLLWGSRWRMHHHGPWGHGSWGSHEKWGEWKPGEGPQSMFDEWHRKAHESGEQEKP